MVTREHMRTRYIVVRSRWHRMHTLVLMVAMLLPLPSMVSGAEGEEPSLFSERSTLTWSFDIQEEDYLVGLGVQSAGHIAQGHGAFFFGDPIGFTIGGGYRNEVLGVLAAYRHESPPRVSYVAVQRQVEGALLIVDYTPSAPDLRLTLENEIFIGDVRLRESGKRYVVHDTASAIVDILANYESRVSLVGAISVFYIIDTHAGAYSVELAAPMHFRDRTIVVEPHLLHSGITRDVDHFAEDWHGYSFRDFSVGRLFGLVPGIQNDTVGTTAAVLSAEYRYHLLRFSGLPVVDGLFLSAFADGGVFGGTQQQTIAGDFTIGAGFGIDWGRLSVCIRAGYNHADRGLVWGVDIEDFSWA